MVVIHAMLHRAQALVVAMLLFSGAALASEWSEPTMPLPDPIEVPAPPEGWDSVAGPFLRVHAASHQYSTALRLSRHASVALPRLALDLGVPIGDTIHIYIAPSDAEFRAMQPGKAPTWADATAYPGLGVIYLRGPGARPATDEPLQQVLEHELVHVLLGRAFAPEVPPDWLQEGVAQVMARQNGPENTEVLSRGMATGALLSLDELTRQFPGDPLRAEVAYAQSADFVSWLVAEHGAAMLPVLVREMATGGSVDAGLYRATGRFLPDLEADWRARLSSGMPLSLNWATSGDALFALAGLALLFGGVLRRRQFHRRLAAMEAQERLVDELVAAYRSAERLAV